MAPPDEDATAAGTDRSEQHWETHGFGLFAVEIRDTGELAGVAGLNPPYSLPEILPAVEIGWRLGRRYWGQGIATEASRAALEFGFTDRRLDRIVGIHQLGNDASGRIMRKLGMQLDREITDSRRRRRLPATARRPALRRPAAGRGRARRTRGAPTPR